MVSQGQRQERQGPEGTTLLQAIESVNKKLAKESLVARFNGRLVDEPALNEDGKLELLGLKTRPARCTATALLYHGSGGQKAKAGH